MYKYEDEEKFSNSISIATYLKLKKVIYTLYTFYWKIICLYREMRYFPIYARKYVYRTLYYILYIFNVGRKEKHANKIHIRKI